MPNPLKSIWAKVQRGREPAKITNTSFPRTAAVADMPGRSAAGGSNSHPGQNMKTAEPSPSSNAQPTVNSRSELLKFAKPDEEEDPAVLEARQVWQESIALLDTTLAEHPQPKGLALKEGSLQGAMTKADAVARDYTSASVFGQVIDQVLQEQKAKDSMIPRKIANILSKLYPAAKIVLQVVAFGADAASFAPLKITANGLAQVVSLAMDEDVRRNDIIDELGKLSNHQQYVDSLRGLNLATLKPLIILRALGLLIQINNYLRVSMLYLASCYAKKAMTGNILEDKVTSCKAALHNAIRDFNEAVGMEAYFIVWQEADDRRRSKALDELTKLRYKRVQSDYRQRRTLNTGQWLLNHPKFGQWVNGTQRCLWCPGIAGAGKTFLTSIVVDHVISLSQQQKPEDLPIGLAYVYCEYANQRDQSIISILCSMIRQLIESETRLVNQLEDFQARTVDTAVGVAEYTGLLRSLLSSFSRVFLVVDALDEFSSVDQDRQDLAFTLRDLTEPPASECHMFLTSRPANDIEKVFDETSKMTLAPMDEDIASYVDMRISESNHGSSWVEGDTSLQSRIRDVVISKSGGMFLLARLQMDQLLAQESVGELEDALETLTSNLGNYYDQAVERIRKLPEANHAKSTLDLLSWVCYAKRPMTIPEIQHALAVTQSDAKSLNRLRRYFKDVNRILGRCAGLVLVRQPDVIVPSHETVQEYFRSRAKELFPNAEVVIPQSCLKYLLLEDFQTGPCLSDNDFNIRIERLPLLPYSSLFWADYVRRRTEAELLSQAVQFLKNNASRESVIQALHVHRTGGMEPSERYPKGLTALHLAAANNLTGVARLLLEDKPDPSAQLETGDTPLHLASAAGFEEIVILLLDAGANVNIVGGDYGTALGAASMNRHEGVRIALLQHGATIDVSIGRFFDRFRDSPTWLIRRLSEADSRRRQSSKLVASRTDMIKEGVKTINAQAPETKRQYPNITFGERSVWEDFNVEQFARASSLPYTRNNPRFECPICFEIVVIGNMYAWKKHVLKDLTPYICTFKYCTSQGYPRISEWLEHESSHWVEWRCGHCELVLGSAVDWTEHMKSQHVSELAQGKQKNGRVCIQVQIPEEECPFCEWEMKEPADQDLRRPATQSNWLPSSRPVLKVRTKPSRPSTEIEAIKHQFPKASFNLGQETNASGNRSPEEIPTTPNFFMLEMSRTHSHITFHLEDIALSAVSHFVQSDSEYGSDNSQGEEAPTIYAETYAETDAESLQHVEPDL